MDRFTISLPQTGDTLVAVRGTNLYQLLRDKGILLNSPCGGNGTCGKCTVICNGEKALSCRTVVDTDMTVFLPEGEASARIMRTGIEVQIENDPLASGNAAAFDIGTTTVVCYLLEEGTGRELANASMLNPQVAYGGDVISRIQSVMDGTLSTQRELVRNAMEKLLLQVCRQASVSVDSIGVAAVVGNPCMQQLFMGIPTDNLSKVPFSPAIVRAEAVRAKEYLPCLREDAQMTVVPDISGYVGDDTIGCVLSTGMYKDSRTALMVDIGTNGEMVLGSRDGLLACSAAAGPAFEGAKILYGMRGAVGAIDHVSAENGHLTCSVIGNTEAVGICGSGLIDAAAAFLELGLMDESGRLQSDTVVDGQRVVYLTDKVFITQKDIRELQMAKGAIAAGIDLMLKEGGLTAGQLDVVYLAGAFGCYMDPKSALAIGLLPDVPEEKICSVGNAAGSGAKLLAQNRFQLSLTQELCGKTRFLELADMPGFQDCFVEHMVF